jgi:TrmH family RNA methyltransferase
MEPAEPVTSAQNPRLKALRALRAGKERDFTALEGRHLLAEALDAAVVPEWILVDEATMLDEAQLLGEAAASGSQVVPCDAALLREGSDLDASTGMVAWIARPRQDWTAVVDGLQAGDWILVAAGVQDPGNLGALARVAAGFGAEALLCLKGGVSPWHPRALRGASGTTFRLPVADRVEVDPLMDALHAKGTQAWATSADGEDLARVVKTGPRARPVALFLGEEGRGLSPQLLAGCSRQVGIPLARGVESLNVATAAAVVAWALCQEQRPRWWGDHA